MPEIQFKIKKKQNIETADGVKTKLEYVPVGDFSKNISIKVDSKNIAESVGLPVGHPEDTVIVVFGAKPSDVNES
jgi:hypothetical protein